MVGIEVGRDQLIERLRSDPRVKCLEGINARALPREQLLHPLAPSGFTGAVMDVSFISQTLIHPELAKLMPPGSRLLSLVKPQFEAGPEFLGKGGIVSDPPLMSACRKKLPRLCSARVLKCWIILPAQLPAAMATGSFCGGLFSWPTGVNIYRAVNARQAVCSRLFVACCGVLSQQSLNADK